MTKKKIIVETIRKLGGVAKTSELIESGISKNALRKWVDLGVLTRARHGFYQLSDDESISEPRLLVKLLPEAVVCMESALFFYGYDDFAPRKWTVAVPRSISLTKLKLEILPIKAYFVQERAFEIGRTTLSFDGASLSIYDRERTICDCFKYRTRLDRETFAKAVRGYVADERKKLDNLSEFAKELGLYDRVMNLMEVFLGC